MNSFDLQRFTKCKTKAETLEFIKNSIQSAQVLPLFYFSVKNWKDQPQAVLKTITNLGFNSKKVVVRSSAITEDTFHSSNAGRYLSLINILGIQEIETGINQVIASYETHDDQNQVLIQPMLTEVALSGVAFGYDPNTLAPYYVINYDDKSGRTDTVTAGSINDLKLKIHHHSAPIDNNTPTGQIIHLIEELASLYGTFFLDIEFAFDKTGILYLFQVRPLIIKHQSVINKEFHTRMLNQISEKIHLSTQPHPYLLGKKTVYGIMPDWNPAEIIGIRPKPLAVSLYREIITNAIWAYQRDNYGYRNLRSFPLLVDFLGLPYIDVRVSFNSFIPKTLSDDIATRLVDYYIQKLITQPSLHDKVEFDIVFSCYTFDLRERLTVLTEHGFTPQDCDEIFSSLLHLTTTIINNESGLWKKDLEKVHKLETRRSQLLASQCDDVTQLYWLIEDCKRYGTLPFAGLARAGFIAVQILKSMVNVNILTPAQYHEFLASTSTVTSEMQHDFSCLNKDDFLKKYGHLRPGTYDILSPRYDEEPDLYFDWSNKHVNKTIERQKDKLFQLSLSQLHLIRNHLQTIGLNIDVIDLMHFMKSAIEAREFAKFIFTKNVSDFLKLVGEFSAKNSIPKEDAAFLNIQAILGLYSTSPNHQHILRESIEQGKLNYQNTQTLNLPPLITSSQDVWSFELQQSSPNFITQKIHRGKVVNKIEGGQTLRQAVVMIESADPGFDWIFSYDIGALITMYGGINSHMAIRAGEMGIPAVIGVGESLYRKLSAAKVLTIDCANKQIIDISTNEKAYSL